MRFKDHRRVLTTFRAGAVAALAVAAGAASVSHGEPLTSSFVYQGLLNARGAPANGVFDLRFRLYDAASAGVQVGPVLCLDNTTITDGAMSAVLDFGGVFDGRRFYLEVEVRTDAGLDCSDGTGYETLAPRQAFSAVPQASYSLAAASAAAATNAGLLNGQAASFYQNAANLTGTIPDARMAGTYSGVVAFSNAGNTFAGNAGGLTGLSASNLASGTVADARLSGNVALKNAANSFGNFTNTFQGSVGIGVAAPNEQLEVRGSLVLRDAGNHPGLRLSPSTAGYGVNPEFVVQDVANGNGTDSSFHLSRNAAWNGSSYNRTDIAQEASSLQFLNNGDIGFFGAAAGANPITWTPSLYIDGTTGFVGVAMNNPGYPINFPATTGDKIVVNGNTATPSGIGFQTSTLQIHSGASGGDISFGYGPSATMTENVRFRGDGRVGINISTFGDTMLHTFTSTRSSAATFETGLAGGVGVWGVATGTTLDTVAGGFTTASNAGTGVYAIATRTTGVTYGVRAYVNSSSANAMAVRGEATVNGANFGVWGSATGASAWGVFANGRLGATGTKSFIIDHPLDPENKYLLHYCLESPEVLNVYSGVAALDGNGEAWVLLPDYFESINLEPRYSLTSVGAAAPMLHVAEEVSGNRFRVAGGAPNAKVSWEVKARRNDRFVQRNGAPSEVEKGEGEKGTYLRPDLYGKPSELGQFRGAAMPVPSASSAANPAR